MRRLLAVTIGAGLLALVLAAPAFAAPNANAAFGQTVQEKAEYGAVWGGWVSQHAQDYAYLIPELAHAIQAGEPIYIPTNPPVGPIFPGDPRYPDTIGDAVELLKPILHYVTPD